MYSYLINMDTLFDTSKINLNILKNLKPKEILLSSRSRELSITEEYIQIDNIHEIENGIYFTFHQILSSLDLITIKEYHQLIEDMDQSIDKIYENDKLSSLMDDENSQFYKIIDNIDNILRRKKELIYYNSPFYNGYYTLHSILDRFYEMNND